MLDENTTASAERQQQIANLFSSNFSTISEMPYVAWPELWAQDHARIIESLPLDTYSGPAESVAFTEWSSDWIREQVALVRFAHYLLSKRGLFLSAIRQATQGLTVDLAVTEDDLLYEVIGLLLRMKEKLLTPGTASLESRIFALARRHCLNHTAKRRRRWRLCSERENDFGCEHVAPQPLDSPGLC